MKEFLQHLRKVRVLWVCCLALCSPAERCAGCACITYLSALSPWLQEVTVGIVGGSDFHKICEQLGSDGACLSPVTLLRGVWKSLRPAQLSLCSRGCAGPRCLSCQEAPDHLPAPTPLDCTRKAHLRLGGAAGVRAFWPG